MRPDTTTAVLRRWAGRARPPVRSLAAAVGLAVLAAVSALALLGGSGVLVVRAAGGGGLAALGGLLIAIELMAFLRAPMRLRERLTAHRVALGSMVRWRIWLYDRIAERTPEGLALSSGDLLDRSIEDVDALQDLYVRLALPVLAACTAGLVGAIWIGIVLPVAGLVLLAAVVAGLVVALGTATRADGLERAGAQARSALSGATADLVAGMAELTMVDGTVAGLGAVEAAAAVRSRRAGRLAWIRGLGGAAEALVVGSGIVAIAILAGRSVSHGQLSGAAAAGIVLLAVAGLEPLPGLIAAAVRAPEVAESARRLEAVESSPSGGGEPPTPATWPAMAVSIRLEEIEAAPPGRRSPVLEGASLDLPPGSRTALLGASGAGKSTLADVLLRFIRPSAGHVWVGDIDLEDLPSDAVLTHVALLDQSSAIFGGTLRDCLRLGAPDASDADMIAVLETCQLSDLCSTPLGLDLVIAEQGGSLSGGQQQRLALARALLRRPRLLILDEPTVGLDPAQAAEVLDLALGVASGATVLLITHDLAEARRCERVVWLSDGRIRALSAAEVADLD